MPSESAKEVPEGMESRNSDMQKAISSDCCVGILVGLEASAMDNALVSVAHEVPCSAHIESPATEAIAGKNGVQFDEVGVPHCYNDDGGLPHCLCKGPVGALCIQSQHLEVTGCNAGENQDIESDPDDLVLSPPRNGLMRFLYLLILPGLILAGNVLLPGPDAGLAGVQLVCSWSEAGGSAYFAAPEVAPAVDVAVEYPWKPGVGESTPAPRRPKPKLPGRPPLFAPAGGAFSKPKPSGWPPPSAPADGALECFSLKRMDNAAEAGVMFPSDAVEIL
ncbi:hypothetical protein Nepgr_007973 [Nepenthes gracilis]|uniref:Uncharacterized protein n=1 Tax=Nepenthes gracilis TaxID=150966 RepID=A0AAD3XIT4_NEPGR|nr:hypothetical protein Nepgr_007973 [Nepenthes gracilis]